MDFWTATTSVARRWYAALPVALAGLVIAGFVLLRIGREYEARASALLMAPPPATPVGGEGSPPRERPLNPLLTGGGTLNTTGEAVLRILDDEARRKGFEAQGFDPDYELTLGRDRSILDLVVREDDPQQALRAAEALLEAARASLAELQERVGAPADQRITANTIVAPSRSAQRAGDRLRAGVTLAVLVAGAAFAAAQAAEAAAEGRLRLRRPAADHPPAGRLAGAALPRASDEPTEPAEPVEPVEPAAADERPPDAPGPPRTTRARSTAKAKAAGPARARRPAPVESPTGDPDGR